MHNKWIKEAETLLKTLSQFLFLCFSAYSTAVAFLQIDDVDDVKKNQRKKDFVVWKGKKNLFHFQPPLTIKSFAKIIDFFTKVIAATWHINKIIQLSISLILSITDSKELYFVA